jgi:hypothetical protein
VITCSTDREKSLLKTELSRALARGTCLQTGTFLGTASTTIGTALPAGYLDLGLLAHDRLFKGDLKVVTEIRTLLGATPCSGTRAPTKKILEDVAEDIPKTTPAEIKTLPAGTSLHTGMPEEIVLLTFLRVTQDIVSLSGLFKFIFSLSVPWISVRMIFESQFTVGLLDLIA